MTSGAELTGTLEKALSHTKRLLESDPALAVPQHPLAPLLLAVARRLTSSPLVSTPPATTTQWRCTAKTNPLQRYESFAQATAFHQSSTTYSREATRFYAGHTPSFSTFDFSVGTGLNDWHVEAFIENAFDERGQLGRNSECNDQVHYCLENAHIYPIKPMQFGVKFGEKF